MDHMHEYTQETEALAQAIVAYARNRIASPQPLDHTVPADELDRRAGATVTPEGLGGDEALRVWAEILAPATISTDHPAALAFVPSAPTKASVLFDLVVGASSTIAAGWIDGAGAIWAENQALAWITELAGFPEDAGGVFTSGGSAGNLSALVTARHAALGVRGGERPTRWRIAACDTVHSSVTAAARVMDVGMLGVAHDERGRLTREALKPWTPTGAKACSPWWPAQVPPTPAPWTTWRAWQRCAWPGGSGSTWTGPTAGPVWWHHRCGSCTQASSARTRSSWTRTNGSSPLTTPAPSSTVIRAWRASPTVRRLPTWTPSIRARSGTRRTTPITSHARGLPLWFSLATYGTDAYRDAVESVLTLTRQTADAVRAHPDLELIMEPDLSVVLFRRNGWADDDYEAWWRRLVESQIAFVQPTSWNGEKVARLCFVNPRTTMDHVRAVLGTMA